MMPRGAWGCWALLVTISRYTQECPYYPLTKQNKTTTCTEHRRQCSPSCWERVSRKGGPGCSRHSIAEQAAATQSHQQQQQLQLNLKSNLHSLCHSSKTLKGCCHTPGTATTAGTEQHSTVNAGPLPAHTVSTHRPHSQLAAGCHSPQNPHSPMQQHQGQQPSPAPQPSKQPPPHTQLHTIKAQTPSQLAAGCHSPRNPLTPQCRTRGSSPLPHHTLSSHRHPHSLLLAATAHATPSLPNTAAPGAAALARTTAFKAVPSSPLAPSTNAPTTAPPFTQYAPNFGAWSPPAPAAAAAAVAGVASPQVMTASAPSDEP
jgi:hypothetical protein